MAADESSTAAIGRIVYTALSGKPPENAETAATLSYLVHHSFGSAQGGLFGALTNGRGDRTVAEGTAFAAAIWLGADELGVSLLGLADGPGKYPLSQHLARWGAHVVYGLTVAATTNLLRRML